ncbi:hypothetical protein BpHYR1_021924 [Brachionus plicatilis]|uniref:Uncharacterized protein n=1 Tax=Brachionus plicatilis TaxID=10195 RepID=A0A3M7QSW5_BRAPC|nr:hypothetical protein BpHYR1_021924 [Brachionus plicatilis]
MSKFSKNRPAIWICHSSGLDEFFLPILWQNKDCLAIGKLKACFFHCKYLKNVVDMAIRFKEAIPPLIAKSVPNEEERFPLARKCRFDKWISGNFTIIFKWLFLLIIWISFYLLDYSLPKKL